MCGRCGVSSFTCKSGLHLQHKAQPIQLTAQCRCLEGLLRTFRIDVLPPGAVCDDARAARTRIASKSKRAALSRLRRWNEISNEIKETSRNGRSGHNFYQFFSQTSSRFTNETQVVSMQNATTNSGIVLNMFLSLVALPTQLAARSPRHHTAQCTCMVPLPTRAKPLRSSPTTSSPRRCCLKGNASFSQRAWLHYVTKRICGK